MDDERFRRLNTILLEALESEHNIGEYDDHHSWFEGSEAEVQRQVAELESLFNEAVDAGIINRWIKPGDRYRSTCWDWSTEGHRKAKALGVSLVGPMEYQDAQDIALEDEDVPVFTDIVNRITTPNEMSRPVSLGKLNSDLCLYVQRVYRDQVRYVVSHCGKPVAALVPLLDLELLKDVETEVAPRQWNEWVQNLRRRLGWPTVTTEDKEA